MINDLVLRSYIVAKRCFKFNFFPYFQSSPVTSDLKSNYDDIENIRLTTMMEF